MRSGNSHVVQKEEEDIDKLKQTGQHIYNDCVLSKDIC